jgi:hypothetical protein
MTHWRSTNRKFSLLSQANHQPPRITETPKVSVFIAEAMSSPETSHPNFLLSRTEDDLPIAKPWWFHSSPLSLDDPLAPLPKSALDEGTWKAFSDIDCQALEEKWEGLPESIKRKEERLPDENAVVDELAFQNIDGNDDVENAKQV